MTDYLRFVQSSVGEAYYIELSINASNGRQTATVQYYALTDSLVELSERLILFPRNVDEVVVFNAYISSESFRMRFSTGTSGNCAIEFHWDNNQPSPEHESCTFCIRAEPLQINQLARLLRQFARLEHERLDWWVDDGALG